MTDLEKVTEQALIDQEKKRILEVGHELLRTNATELKQWLMDERNYDMFISDIEKKLESATTIEQQSRYLALILELNVQDVTRIGEPLIVSLQHDLQIKANGVFEFIPGDRNVARALLSLLSSDKSIQDVLTVLCENQSDRGVATPFDYRRLTILFKNEFSKTTEEEWKHYFINLFQNASIEDLLGMVEVGRSFASTKQNRYTEEQEELIKGSVNNPKNLLDIGGSIGVSAEYLMRVLNISEGTVTDSRSEEELRRVFYGSFEKKSGLVYVLGEAGDITKKTPDNNQYDVVTVNNVLVHVLAKEIALQNILPRIRDGGLLVMLDGFSGNLPRKVFTAIRVSGGRIQILS